MMSAQPGRGRGERREAARKPYGPTATDQGTDTNQSLALMSHLARVARRGTEQALAPLGLRPRHLIALTLLRDRGPATSRR